MTPSKSTKGLFSLFFTTLLILFVLFSTLYTAHEINHDCVQEQCPICACIQLTKQTIKHLSLGFGRASLVPLILFIFLLSRLFMLPFLPYLTLVSQKVRMDN